MPNKPRPGKSRPRPASPLPTDPAALARMGLHSFHAGNYPAAIHFWEKLLSATDDPASRGHLAEAHFRRSFQAADTPALLYGLQQAVRHAPEEPRYLFHLALALHRANHQAEALEHYSRLAEGGFARPGFALLRGLAALELHPQAPLGAIEWLEGEERESLAPISALLSGRPAEVAPELAGLWESRFHGKAHANPDFNLWYGLAQLGLGKYAIAQRALHLPQGAQLPAAAESTRLYYHALALEAGGDLDGAIREWIRLLEKVPTGRVREQILDASRRHIRALLAQGRLGEAAVALTRAIETLGESPVLAEPDLDIHERLSAEALAQERWEDAALGWRRMLHCLDINPLLGPRSPLLHNLALAMEQGSKWVAAAQYWEELLGEMLPAPRPRKSPGTAARQRALPPPGAAHPAAAGGDGDPQQPRRSWIRRRIIGNYRQAGRPAEAIAWMRRELREQPNDAALRLELADALQHAQYPGAGRGELKKVLQGDPGNSEARLMLAEQSLESGRLEEAEKLLRGLLDQDPGNPRFRRGMVELHRARGRQRLEAGQPGQAIGRFAAALELEPERRELQLDMAEAEYRAGDPPRARSRLESLLEAGKPEDFLAVLGFWIALDLPREARALVERAVGAGRADTHLLIDVAGVFLEAGEPDDPDDPDDPYFGAPWRPHRARPKGVCKEWRRLGRQWLERAERLGGKDPRVLEHILDMWFSMHSPEAMIYLQRLLALQPGNPSLHVKHALILAIEGRFPQAEQALQRADGLARKAGDEGTVTKVREVRQTLEEMQQALPFAEFLDDPDFWDLPDFPDSPFRKGFRPRGRK